MQSGGLPMGTSLPAEVPSPIALIREHGGANGRRLVTTIATWQLLQPYAKKLTQRLRKRGSFTITVPGSDEIYADLHEWVLRRLPQDDRKALIASSGKRYDEYERSPGDKPKTPKLLLRYDGTRVHTVSVSGHRVSVSVARDEFPGRERIPDNWRQLTESIVFTAENVAGRNAVISMIEGLIVERYAEKGPPPLLVPYRYGGSWNRRMDLPPRTLESVVLKAGQLEGLVEDLRSFLADEELYARWSQPWHRGYLFYGPPGTGKTSVARALANEFDLPTHYLPLGDLERDADLMGLVGSIPPKSLLLIEDVDVFHAATNREDESSKSSVASMLNALDGVWTPHGLITILTTNHRESLDPALLRAGRIDIEEEFTALDAEQSERLASWLGVGYPVYDGWEGLDPAAAIKKVRDAALRTKAAR